MSSSKRDFREEWRQVCQAHRSSDATAYGVVRDFLFPKITRGFLIRLGVVALLSVALFGFFLKPCFIDGESMIPTYPGMGFALNWRWKYLFREPQRGDVVIIRLAGRKYYLKRIIGLPGETIAFHHGICFINGQPLKEPYVHYICNWELPPRKVKKGHYYVIGDNRSQPINGHYFGQVDAARIEGGPLW